MALVTSLTLLMSSIVNANNPLRNTVVTEVNASQSKEKQNNSQKYPNIESKLDLTSMAQYSSVNLYMNVTLKKFYIKDYTNNDQDEYRLLLAPIKSSNQYFIATVKSNKKFKVNQRITIKGFLNGRIKIDNELIATGFESKYLNKKVVSIMPDVVSIDS